MSKKLQLLLSVLVGVLLLVVIFTTSVPKRDLTFAEKIWRDMIKPIQKGFSAVGTSLTNTIDYISSLRSATEEVAILKEELQRSQLELQRLKEVELENLRLRELVGFKVVEGLDLIPTRVIGRDPRVWLKTIVIDKGEKNGITIGTPIVTHNGIVGYVTGTSNYTAQVTLLVDPKTTVGGIVQRTRDFVIIDSADSKGILKVTPLYQKEDTEFSTSSVVEFQEGDVVITSGYGGIYPKGLTVGTITTVSQETEGIIGYLTPSVDFRRLEEVFILGKGN